MTSPFPAPVATWPSLTDLPALYPDARNRANRGPLLYRAGKTWPLRPPLDLRGRLPLLAVGSNAYPRQLHDKLTGHDADRHGVPLIPALIRDLDTAYCPIRARKGYVPVTLTSRPGAIALTWLQWLTPAQLDLIAASEGPRYALVGGPPLAARTRLNPRLPRPPHIYAWWFDSILEHNGQPAWLDVHHAPPTPPPDLDGSDVRARPNPPPAGWRQIPRPPGDHAIDQESMSKL